MTIGEFWKQQNFSCLATYSFNRGPKRAALKAQLEPDLETGRYMRRPAIQQQLQNLDNFLTLTDKVSAIHPTATLIAKLPAVSVGTQKLAAAFRQAAEQECYAMCRPVYRDALAFYSEAEVLVSVLNICFECRAMQTDKGQHIAADMATYDFLQQYLLGLGHPIENQA